jgi:hypothetical protein
MRFKTLDGLAFFQQSIDGYEAVLHLRKGPGDRLSSIRDSERGTSKQVSYS